MEVAAAAWSADGYAPTRDPADEFPTWAEVQERHAFLAFLERESGRG